MDVLEANEIIAGFMGEEGGGYVLEYTGFEIYPTLTNIPTEYSKSLDKLVPVWEKLKVIVTHLESHSGKGYAEVTSYKKHPIKGQDFIGVRGTIQETAAIATAKAIQELS